MSDAGDLELLERFADAWNRHDVTALMQCMTEDCVYDASGGPEAHGKRYEGQRSVAEGFREVFAVFADARWTNARHFVSGARAVSEWTFVGTRRDDVRVEVDGCDLFILKAGKIARKNTYRKNRTP
jgi:ketosteroid isomerase-like protein